MRTRGLARADRLRPVLAFSPDEDVVDLDGISGHNRDASASWGRPGDPAVLAEIGDEIRGATS